MSEAKTFERIFLSPPHQSGRELELVRRALESNYLAPAGPQLAAFEKAFSEAVGLPHCVAVANGTAALHLILRILGVGPGDVVPVSTLTFIGGVSPIAMLGAAPVFIDSEPASWNVDPGLLAEAVEALVKEGTPPKAVVCTDIYGQCADYDRLLEVLDPLGIPLVADSAEALGATYKDAHAGARARAAVYSFNGNKIITTSGGGMLATRDKKLADEARWLSQQAREPQPHYEHEVLGYNYRMSNVLAALGLAQLEALDERVAAKRAVFENYSQALDGVPGVRFMPEAAYGRANRWLTVVLIDPEAFGADREEVRLALEARNIESRPMWKPMHLQPVFKGARTFGGAFSEKLFEQGLCLPSGSQLTAGQISLVAETMLAARRK